MNDQLPDPSGSPPGPQDPADLELDPAQLDAELDADDGALQGSLRALLAPPSDIEHRVADEVSQQLIARSAAGTALDLLGLGVRTLMTILTEPPAAADRDGTDAASGGGTASGSTAEGRVPT
jgi:hypothetical protein